MMEQTHISTSRLQTRETYAASEHTKRCLDSKLHFFKILFTWKHFWTCLYACVGAGGGKEEEIARQPASAARCRLWWLVEAGNHKIWCSPRKRATFHRLAHFRQNSRRGGAGGDVGPHQRPITDVTLQKYKSQIEIWMFNNGSISRMGPSVHQAI